MRRAENTGRRGKRSKVAHGFQGKGTLILERYIRWLGLVGLAVAAGALGASAQPSPPPPDAAMMESAPQESSPSMDPEQRRRWFFLLSFVNAYPQLEREGLIKQYYDPVVRALAPGFDGVHTFSDMRDDHLLWPPQVAVGYLLNDHLALSMHAGYSEGTLRTKASETSLALLPLYVDFKIRRSALYAGLDLDYYPFGAVESRKYHGVWDRVRSARPALGARVTWTDAGFKARVRMGLWPVKDLIDVRLSDSWVIPSLNLNVGLDIPMNRNSVLALNAGQNFFREEKQDFNGPAFTVAWRYFFR